MHLMCPVPRSQLDLSGQGLYYLAWPMTNTVTYYIGITSYESLGHEMSMNITGFEVIPFMVDPLMLQISFINSVWTCYFFMITWL